MASKKRFKQKFAQSPGTAFPPSGQAGPLGSPLRKAPTQDLYSPPRTLPEFAAHCRKLLPFIIPRGKHALKLNILVIACFALLVIGRYINVLVPLSYKRVVDELGGLTEKAGKRGGDRGAPAVGKISPSSLPYASILSFVALRFLAGGGGLLSTLQSNLWIPVGQVSRFNGTRLSQSSMAVTRPRHFLTVSDAFGKKLLQRNGTHAPARHPLVYDTGNLYRGVASIVSILSSIIFNIVPTLADISIACFYFATQFDIYFGLIVFCTMSLYIATTVIITEHRTKYRRISNALNNAMEAKAVDSLLNFEVVKYYNAEEFEVFQFKKGSCWRSVTSYKYFNNGIHICPSMFNDSAVKAYQKADFYSNMALAALHIIQNSIIQVGLGLGCALAAKRIIHDQTMTVGEFVLFFSYLTQLYRGAQTIGNQYRLCQKNFVDMEKMLDLFKEPIEIQDPPIPAVLTPQEGCGEVVFENVSFSYDPRRPVLQNLSFRVKPGETCALVGPSGSGKSTVLRLLFRFYDAPEGGRVLIDGEDIKNLAQKDLRGMIGVVPQDTVLFNESIKYNILYGRPTATDAEVLAAAESAQIHDRIMSFPDGYDTKVGERGLRLSGGEKQRVAVARTLLKNPKIILLDEATSALDNAAEAALQSALLTKARTTIVIAHRLSTIVNADQILVIKDGQCVERGTHESLMQMRDGGVYFDMWMKQLKDELGLGGLARMESVGRWVEDTNIAAARPSNGQEGELGGDRGADGPRTTTARNASDAAGTTAVQNITVELPSTEGGDDDPDVENGAQYQEDVEDEDEDEEFDDSSATGYAPSRGSVAAPAVGRWGASSDEGFANDDALPLSLDLPMPQLKHGSRGSLLRGESVCESSNEGSTRAVLGDARTEAGDEVPVKTAGMRKRKKKKNTLLGK
ncbi:ATP-binding cassette sub- B member 6, mitochondrial [Geranomyces michiganensis]|nr:ATP-binding cassette sub- B member 6, mitochondrial [Geranomyces michiganensis]